MAFAQPLLLPRARPWHRDRGGRIAPKGRAVALAHCPERLSVVATRAAFRSAAVPDLAAAAGIPVSSNAAGRPAASPGAAGIGIAPRLLKRFRAGPRFDGSRINRRQQ
jgi:hypothetical protein